MSNAGVSCERRGEKEVERKKGRGAEKEKERGEGRRVVERERGREGRSEGGDNT